MIGIGPSYRTVRLVLMRSPWHTVALLYVLRRVVCCIGWGEDTRPFVVLKWGKQL